MDNEFAADLITLIDDEGTEHEFEILDVIESDEGTFYALLPTFDDPGESLEADGMYYILRRSRRMASNSWQRWRMKSC